MRTPTPGASLAPVPAAPQAGPAPKGAVAPPARQAPAAPAPPARRRRKPEPQPRAVPAAGAWTNRARIEALLGQNRKTVAVLGACSILSGICEAAVLTLLVEIAGALVKKSGRAHETLGLIHFHQGIATLFAVAFALVVVRLVLQVPLSVLPARIASQVQGRLRTQLFDAFTRASWDIQSRDREGTLQETLTGQVMQATGGAMQSTQLMIASFTFLVLLVSAIIVSPIAAVAVAITGVLLFGLLRPLNAKGAQYAKNLSAAQLNYAAGVSEASRLAQETQVFGVDGPQRARIHALIGHAEALFFRTQVILRMSPALYQSGILILLVGGLAILWRTNANIAGLGAAILLIVRAGTFGQQVQSSYQALRQSLPFVERLQESVRHYAESEPPHGQQPLERVESLGFHELSFAYTRTRPVLKRITFDVPKGEAIGVVGPSGAGKSTLIQLLLRLRDPSSGDYVVNGVPAGRFRWHDWHRQVAFVPQEPRLIHASVAENIRYYRDIPAADVERAAHLARIHEEVISWPRGYETIVGPRADAVSGGQQQRICLARALAARPTVLVLDEPTSALDPHSEILIQESLQAIRHELTLFVIAHRHSTLDICDRVMVIVDGELTAFDTTAMLERDNAYFRSASSLAAGGTLP
jgi:ABC-type multidrug transport system fused ATPase/permease subunit